MIRTFIFFALFALQAQAIENTIIVFGEAKTEISADQWQVNLSIEVRKAKKELVNETYNLDKKTFFKRMSALGLKKSDIKSRNFSMSPWYEWKNGERLIKGFQLRHTFLIKNDKLNLIGKIISNISDLKTVSVKGIQHLLKESSKKKVLKGLYGQAFQDAKTKIDAILTASNKSLKGYRTISEDLYSQDYGRPMMKSAMRSESHGSRQANISLVPMDIKLNTKLRVVAEFK